MSDFLANELKVYIKPGCPWCVGVTSYLQNENYEFLEIDVLASDKAMEEMEEVSGQTLAPTVTYGDLVVADCGVPELKKFLRTNEITPAMTA